MKKTQAINVASFTTTPWPRYIRQWDKSGELFYEEVLKPFFTKEAANFDIIEINLDWTKWYPSSFLSESFGRLYKFHSWKEIWNKIRFISNDDPSWIDFINRKAPKYGE